MPVPTGIVASHRSGGGSSPEPDIVLNIDKYDYGGGYFYHVVNWNPADFTDGQIFECWLILEGGEVLPDTSIYLDTVNWNYLRGIVTPLPTDGSLARFQNSTVVYSSRIADLPSDTIYTLKCIDASPKILEIQTPDITKQKNGIISSSGIDWLDGISHILDLKYSPSTITPRGWLTNDNVNIEIDGVSYTMYGTVQMSSFNMGDYGALCDNGFDLDLQYMPEKYIFQFAPIDVFTISPANCSSYSDKVRFNTNFTDWTMTDGTSKTCPLLIADALTAADDWNKPVTTDIYIDEYSSYAGVPVYKSDGTTEWTGPEFFALKDQSITATRVGGSQMIVELA